MPVASFSTPLFVRFANGDITQYDVARLVAASTQEDSVREIAVEVSESTAHNIGVFQADFRALVHDICEWGVSTRVRSFLTDYMSSAIELHVENHGLGSMGRQDMWYTIIGKDKPWVEAAICFNLTIFLKNQGQPLLKTCKVCKKIFVNKGKYATYCSDSCKAIGGKA